MPRDANSRLAGLYPRPTVLQLLERGCVALVLVGCNGEEAAGGGSLGTTSSEGGSDSTGVLESGTETTSSTEGAGSTGELGSTTGELGSTTGETGSTTGDSEGSGVMFRGLGDLPGGEYFSEAADVSGDGMVIVGYSVSGAPSPGVEVATEAVRWIDADPVPLSDIDGALFSEPQAVSGDGLVAVGYAQTMEGSVSCRWTKGRGAVALDGFPEGTTDSRAYAASADGSVIVGEYSVAGGTEAFRWEGGTVEPLGHLFGALQQSTAHGVSADGAVVVGASAGEAFRWEEGEMMGLGHLPSCAVPSSQAMAVSADGAVVVGTSCHGDGLNEHEAFRWQDGRMLGLGDLEGGSFVSQALDVSADGSVVIGAGRAAEGNRAFVWTQSIGMTDLKSMLETEVDLDGWTLEFGRGISSDGSVIVGSNNGYAGQGNPDGQTEGWQVSGLQYR